MLTLDHFREARKILRKTILATPLVYSDYYSKRTGNRVFLKPENMQLTGAYKIRGALYKVAKLSEEQRQKGLITASAGNHAQGVALAAQLYNVSATVVMPKTTPIVKVNNTKMYGGNVILEGDIYDDAYEFAQNLAREKDLIFVHPFNDLDIATGQGTIAYEIIQELPDVEVIILPIGGGGLISGAAALAKLLKPNVHIIGVEPAGAACMKRSFEEGKIASLEKVETIADGVAVKTPGDVVFPYVQKYVDEILTIEDHELIDAFLDMLENHKMLVENAGLLPVALLNHLPHNERKTVVPVLSGGNMDVLTISSLVQHGLRNRGRVFRFKVQLPDKPGELLNVAKILAKEQGNVIKLDHNQLVNINRNSAVELRVTLEAFGHEHKRTIMQALADGGYNVELC